jgi:hypothetical protein
MPLTQEQQEAVRMGTPIEWNGLTLFPILMKDYNRFIIAQMGLTAQQQTLPSKYVVMRYLEALYALDYDVRTNGGPQGGFFSRILLFLMLSLRLEVRKGLDGEEYIPIGIQTEKDNPRKLTALEVTQGEVSVEITPQNFVQLREILAAQNEVELPDETLNAELVQAERDLAAKSSLNLVPDSEALIYSVSVKMQIPVEDIFQWTVRRFVLTERAIDRITGHLVAALSEAAGAKYKNGNPWPSWKYDRDKHSSALVSLAELTQRLSGSVEAR